MFPDTVIFGAAGWAVHMVVAGAAIVVVAFLWRHRLRMEPWESLVFFVPFGLWLGLSTATTIYPKTSTNLVVEPAFLGLAIGLAAFLRAAFVTRGREDALARRLFYAVLVAAVAIWRFTPKLGL